MRALHKTTIVIWSEENTDEISGEDLTRDADRGDAYCSVKNCVLVTKPDEDDDWDGTEFFDSDAEEDDEDEDEDDEDDDEVKAEFSPQHHETTPKRELKEEEREFPIGNTGFMAKRIY